MDEILNDLKEKGLKKTKHRLAILKIFKASNQPLSADEVFKKLKNSEINLSTIYRNLELLAEKEILNKLILSGDQRAVFEYNEKIHRHYLICLSCNKIKIIEHCPLEGYEKRLAEESGYYILGHKLDVYGYCPQCQKIKSQV